MSNVVVQQIQQIVNIEEEEDKHLRELFKDSMAWGIKKTNKTKTNDNMPDILTCRFLASTKILFDIGRRSVDSAEGRVGVGDSQAKLLQRYVIDSASDSDPANNHCTRNNRMFFIYSFCDFCDFF